MPITMAFWSAFLYIASDAGWLVRFATSVLGVAVGARLYVLRSEEEDKMSHKLYDVSVIHFVISNCTDHYLAGLVVYDAHRGELAQSGSRQSHDTGACLRCAKCN